MQSSSSHSVVNVLVANPKLKINTVGDLLAQAKQRKTPFTYASSGTGAFGHLTGELFRATTGIELTHVPYKGGGPGIVALIGGETDLSFATYPSVMPHIKAGRLTLVAVSTFKRSRLLPDTPTIAESGVPGFGVDNWQGLMTPPRLPRKILVALKNATKRQRSSNRRSSSNSSTARARKPITSASTTSLPSSAPTSRAGNR